MPGVESLEPRLCLSGGSELTRGSGIDSIAMGDVNGDQVVDVAVASEQNGQYQVTIFSGLGETDKNLASHHAPKVLATIPDPFSPSAGPLNVALGDFSGSGISELAISSQDSNQISFWTFRQTPAAHVDGPLNQPVTPIPVGTLYTPPGFEGAKGINLAAVSLAGNGIYQLVVAPATNGPGEVELLSYVAPTGWQVTQTIGNLPVDASKGLSVSAGDLTDDGAPDIVVGSEADGKVAVLSEALGEWVWSLSPLGSTVTDLRVAVDSSEGESGSLVVTGTDGGRKAAIIPWGGSSHEFKLAKSPGSGDLVPLGAGYVYRPSTIVKSKADADDSSSFKYSRGPATPVVLFAATGGSHFVIQQFKPMSTNSSSQERFTPSKKDTYKEPLWGAPGKGFIPMQVSSDPDATGKKASTNKLVPSIGLVVLPQNDYVSPFSINLDGVPASVTAGLLPIEPAPYTGSDAWGPAATINTPPAVNKQTTLLSLQERIIAAYKSFLGVDYQHHHNPLWVPSQKNSWNVTGTLSYQSAGVDCTNFTAAAYADALGIKMTGDTTDQSEIAPGNTVYEGQTPPDGAKNYITLPKTDGSPSGIDNWIHIQTFWPPSSGWTYQGLVNLLQPGDILYITGKPGGKVTHAITWLGQFGVDSKGKDPNLIIDSTGITPQHVDSNNRIIPEGVHIRPFVEGNGKAPNTWYFANVSHVMRIIGPPIT